MMPTASPPSRIRGGSMSTYPPATVAWRAVGLLSLLYCLSFVDRMILSLLVTPMKAELTLSDTQIGILFGLSFAALYTLAGLPLARIADSGDRRRLVASGVIVWSLATMLSGFARDYSTLLVGRAGVAIGEAVLTPTAVSLIADLFPRERRAAPTSLYSAVGTLSGLAAFAIGGAVFELATALSPAVGEMAPWRLTLVLVGAPGVLLALAFLVLVREPPRGETEARAGSRDVLAHVSDHARLYAPVFVGAALVSVVGYALLGWTPTLLTRRFGLSTSDAGYMFGAVGLASGTIGAIALPWLAGRLNRRGRGDGLPLVGLAFTVIAVPGLLVAFTADRLGLFACGLGLALSMLLGVTLLPSLVVQQVTPGRQQAQVMAIYLVVASLFGLGVGPALTGFLSDHVFRDGGPGQAIMAISLAALPLATLLLWQARGAYVRLANEGRAGPGA